MFEEESPVFSMRWNCRKTLLDKIRKYNGNLLIIHADLDDIIPFSQAELMLLESPSKNKDIYRVNGANHNNIILIAREDYFKKIKNFISSND